MYEDQPAHLPVLNRTQIHTGDRTVEQPVDRTVAETWCHWHGGFTDSGRLVAAVEQGSGPGAHRYACAPCRKEHRLTLWDEPAGT